MRFKLWQINDEEWEDQEPRDLEVLPNETCYEGWEMLEVISRIMNLICLMTNKKFHHYFPVEITEASVLLHRSLDYITCEPKVKFRYPASLSEREKKYGTLATVIRALFESYVLCKDGYRYADLMVRKYPFFELDPPKIMIVREGPLIMKYVFRFNIANDHGGKAGLGKVRDEEWRVDAARQDKIMTDYLKDFMEEKGLEYSIDLGNEFLYTSGNKDLFLSYIAERESQERNKEEIEVTVELYHLVRMVIDLLGISEKEMFRLSGLSLEEEREGKEYWDCLLVGYIEINSITYIIIESLLRYGDIGPKEYVEMAKMVVTESHDDWPEGLEFFKLKRDSTKKGYISYRVLFVRESSR